MSEGRDLLEAARVAQSIEHADDLARQAVMVEPDLADAYLVRGQLAVHAGKAEAAAYHLRVAFARGARDGFTRDVLATLLDQVGQSGLANRMRAGVTPPAQLHAISGLGPGGVAAVRGALSRPLPPAGTPGLLPSDERRPSTASLSAVPAISTAPLPSIGPAPTGSLPPMSLPPAEAPSPRQTIAPRPSTTGPFGAPIRPPSMPITPVAPSTRGPTLQRVGPAAPDWLEATPEFTSDAEAAQPDWLDDDLPAPEEAPGSVRFEAGGIELALDPGVVEGGFTSPVTGERISAAAQEMDRRDGAVPDLPGVADAMEGFAHFAGDYAVESLDLAVYLPGPVLTRPGRPPQTLTRKVALALHGVDLLMADVSTPGVPVQRLPLSGFERIDVLKQGGQVSFVYSDGRALHLDLRGLRQRALLVAVRMVDLLSERVDSLG